MSINSIALEKEANKLARLRSKTILPPRKMQKMPEIPSTTIILNR